MKYGFIQQHQQHYGVRQQCQAFGVARSGFYAWLQRQPRSRDPQRQALLGQIERIHRQSRGTYGSPRIYAQLKAEGWAGNRKRIARLMRQNGIVGRCKRRKALTTDSQHAHPLAPNLLDRQFGAERVNQKWVADLTYIPTREGWLYLAAVMDLYSRKIVGFSMQPHLTAELVEDALRMALYERQPDPGLLHHSDRGSQYASGQIRRLLEEHAIQVSMSRKGNCYDNAVMESFFSTLKRECVSSQVYPTRKQASLEIFAYIAGYYNRVRLHSTLGYASPEQFEAEEPSSP